MTNAVGTERPETPTLSAPSDVVGRITAFVDRVVADAGADGVVVCLSGGIDSTVAATLAVEALGSDAVTGLLLPADATDDGDERDARAVANSLEIDHCTLPVQPHLDGLLSSIVGEQLELSIDVSPQITSTATPAQTFPSARSAHRRAIGNAAARLRMTTAYFVANVTDRLVLGTGNRTERLLGYSTKYGDGGVDLLPIGDRYKTEVRQLARSLDVPDRIVEKPPTAGLWADQTDEAELGAPYELIEAILRALVDDGASVAATARRLDVDRDLVAQFDRRYRDSAHKRRPVPTPSSYSERPDAA